MHGSILPVTMHKISKSQNFHHSLGNGKFFQSFSYANNAASTDSYGLRRTGHVENFNHSVSTKPTDKEHKRWE